MRKRKLFILLVGIFLTFYICAGTTIEDFNYNNNLGKYNEKSTSSNNNPPSNSGNSTSSSYSSSSSSSSSNNSESNNKDKDKDDEQPRVDPDEEEVSSISGERFLIEFIEKQNEGVEDLTVTSKVSAQDKAQAMALKRVEDQTPTVVKTNSKKIKTNEDSAKTTTSGDPVKISTGTYEQKETDLVIGTLNQFEIKRRYESDNSITGSFGYGWFSNLDQRIILGTDPNIQEEIDALKTYKNELNESINNLETDLAASYHVSSIYNA